MVVVAVAFSISKVVVLHLCDHVCRPNFVIIFFFFILFFEYDSIREFQSTTSPVFSFLPFESAKRFTIASTRQKMQPHLPRIIHKGRMHKVTYIIGRFRVAINIFIQTYATAIVVKKLKFTVFT